MRVLRICNAKYSRLYRDDDKRRNDNEQKLEENKTFVTMSKAN